MDWLPVARGYGVLSRAIAGHIYAHRYAYALVYGCSPVPGFWILHRCDNPPCCNPSHLFIGTPTDNAQDRNLKGRHPIAQRVPLTAAEQDEIYIKRESGISAATLAKEYGVSQSTISRVVPLAIESVSAMRLNDISPNNLWL